MEKFEHMSAKSFIQYHLLKMEYRMVDVDYIKERAVKAEIMKGNFIHMGIRKTFLKKVKKHFGTLKCQVCNTKDLIENAVGRDKKSPKLATIEHLNPISQGGLRYVESNFICTCNKCNNDRGDKPIFHIGDGMYIF